MAYWSICSRNWCIKASPSACTRSCSVSKPCRSRRCGVFECQGSSPKPILIRVPSRRTRSISQVTYLTVLSERVSGSRSKMAYPLPFVPINDDGRCKVLLSWYSDELKEAKESRFGGANAALCCTVLHLARTTDLPSTKF